MSKLYLDVSKALNTSKLVKKQVQVKGKNGKVFTRMQWVDPNSDQPVFHNRTLSKEEKAEYSSKLRNREKMDAPENIEPFQSRLGIEPTEENELSSEQVDYMKGKVGTLELKKLTEGTPLFNDERAIKLSNNLMSQHPVTKDHIDNISIKDHIASVFKNVTKEGLEYVFSDPKDKYTAKLTQLSCGYNNKHGYIEICMDLEWSGKKGDYVGYTSRTLHRDKNGNLHVYNDITQIESKHQGKGVTQNEQERSEQLWRYLSDGHPINISLEANINVGVYAWALKGYDFVDDKEVDTAREQLEVFLKKNDFPVEETLKACGYNSVRDLQHSWQFASLDDGTTYDAGDILLDSNNPDKEIQKKTKKGVSLGKAFMLGGKTAWDGEKILNGNTEHEEIASLYTKKSKLKSKKVG